MTSQRKSCACVSCSKGLPLIFSDSVEILRLRELQEQKGMDDATQKEHTKRIKELQKFIQSQPSEIMEFDEALVKKLLEKVTVHDDYLEFRFKSGVTISIEM